LFIRGALLDGTTLIPHRFFAYNQKLRDRLEAALTRVRSSRVYAIEEHLFEFYRARIHGVSSIHDLNKLVNERIRSEPDFLCVAEDDLTGGDDLSSDLEKFPDQASVGNNVLPITYAYKPGQEDDGVTVQVPLPLAEKLTSGQLQWMVPGLREELIETLLRALPKVIRRSLMPIEATAKKIAREFNPGRADFLEALAIHLRQIYQTPVSATDWPPQSVPAHLQPRVQVMAQGNKSVIASRDLDSIRASLQKQERRSDAWERTVPRFEKYGVPGWTFGDLPESIVIEEINGVPVLGHPGLSLREGEVDVRLFRKAEEAAAATPSAVRKLAEMALGKDIAWLQKELRGFDGAAKPAPKAQGLQDLAQLTTKALNKSAPAPARPLSEQAQEHLLAHALRLEPLLPLTEKRFQALCESVRRDLPALTQRVRDLLKQCDDWRQKIMAYPKRYPGMEHDLVRLLPLNVLEVTPHAQLQHLPRYLKAIYTRAERAANNPAKDSDKALVIRDFQGWENEVRPSNHEAFRWMFEEYRVSIFAQEFGTAQPVSLKRLEALLG
jgi:ATP-dependent helicase HrpA